jgi:hypothetical protein
MVVGHHSTCIQEADPLPAGRRAVRGDAGGGITRQILLNVAWSVGDRLSFGWSSRHWFHYVTGSLIIAAGMFPENFPLFRNLRPNHYLAAPSRLSRVARCPASGVVSSIPRLPQQPPAFLHGPPDHRRMAVGERVKYLDGVIGTKGCERPATSQTAPVPWSLCRREPPELSR